MKARANRLAAVIVAILALAACTDRGAAGGASPVQKDAPERPGSDHGGGGMM